jgi:crossover junction endodeoxyribonuclease RuvC
MRVLGVDCGTEYTGYGVVEPDVRSGLRYVAAGTIRLNRKHPTADRLARIFSELSAHIEAYQPDVVAIEEVFFSANAKSALKLGQVRGVAFLAAALAGRPVAEYAPLSIKSAVVGYGLAQKEQVGFMVMRLLRLEHAPDSADAADALAIAICHVHTAQTLSAQGGANIKMRSTLR